MATTKPSLSVTVVSPTATYDPLKGVPTERQHALAKAGFELAQAIRREKSAEDPDSPGTLTPMEILQNVALKSPGVIDAFVNLTADPVDDVKDFVAVGYLVQAQLLA